MRILWAPVALLTSYLALGAAVNLFRSGVTTTDLVFDLVVGALMAAGAVPSWRRVFRRRSVAAKGRGNPFEARRRPSAGAPADTPAAGSLPRVP